MKDFIKSIFYKKTNKDINTNKEICPNCNGNNVVPIAYGLYDYESISKLKDVHLGGCVMSYENRYCRSCEYKFEIKD